MDTAHQTVLLTARCHCEKHVFTTSIPSSALPLHASLCHCTSCRRNTGALYFGCTAWPNPEEDLSRLKRYPFSPGTDVFSCGACASQLFCRGTRPGEPPEVVTSALVEDWPDLVRYSRNIFVGDTVDGGASVLLGEWADGQPLERWRGHGNKSEELPLGWPYGPKLTEEEGDQEHGPVFTRLACHCNGVNLFLRTAPDDKPRLIVDACPASRQAVSADIVFWASATIGSIVPEPDMSSASLFASSTDMDMVMAREDTRLGTLGRDSRAPHDEQTTTTYSCKACSATFFQVDEESTDRIFVALGVVDYPGGARAEGLLSWKCVDILGHEESVGWRSRLYDTVNKALRARSR